MSSMTFKDILKCLVYDVEKKRTINKECEGLKIPQIHTSSKDSFTNFVISLSHYFKEHLVAEKTDLKRRRYVFKCCV